MVEKKMSTGKLIGIVGAALLIVGSFLPWAKVELLGFSETISGLDGDGVIQIGLGVIALILLLLKKVKVWIPLIFGALALIVAFMDYSSLAEVNAQSEGLSSMAYGLYVVLLGAIGMVVGPIVALVKKK